MRLYLCSLLLVLFCKVVFAHSALQKKAPCHGVLSATVSEDSRFLVVGKKYTLYFQDKEGSRKIFDAVYEGFSEVYQGASRHRFLVEEGDAEGKKQRHYIEYKNLDDLKDAIVLNEKKSEDVHVWASLIDFAKNANLKVVKVNDWLEVAFESGTDASNFLSRISSDIKVIERSYRSMGFDPANASPVRILYGNNVKEDLSFKVAMRPILNTHEKSPRTLFFLNPKAADREKKNIGVYSHELSHTTMNGVYGLESIVNRNQLISEAVADFMAAQSISSPKTFYTFGDRLVTVRDISQSMYIHEPISIRTPLDHYDEEGSFQYHRGSMAMSHLLWKLRELEGTSWVDGNFKKILDLIAQSESKIELIHGIKETKKRYPKHYDFIEYEYALGMLRGYVEKHASLNANHRELFLREFDRVVLQFNLDPKQIEVFSSMVDKPAIP